jgi:acylphosphatase
VSRARWVIHGRVQGVGFRASAREQARVLGVRCEARNRGDGTVEVVAEGDEPSLDALEGWLRVGPPLARVDSVQRLAR